MNLEKYATKVSTLDTTDLLSEWGWLVPTTFTPLLLTKFGDWFFLNQAGRLVFLDLLEGALFDLGDFAGVDVDDDEFMQHFKDQLSIDWTEICLSRGLITSADRCYGWKLHPIIGGKFEFDNITTFSARLYQSLVSQLLRQVKSGMKITGFTLQIDGKPAKW